MGLFDHLQRYRVVDAQLRDDNLRLIFAGEQQRLLDERLRDIVAGAVLLIIMVAATAAFTLAMVSIKTGTVSVPSDGGLFAVLIGLLTAFAGLVWAILVVAALLSPLIAALLLVEYARTKRTIAEHRAFLASYNRL